jgi:hypothetical protein
VSNARAAVRRSLPSPVMARCALRAPDELRATLAGGDLGRITTDLEHPERDR